MTTSHSLCQTAENSRQRLKPRLILVRLWCGFKPHPFKTTFRLSSRRLVVAYSAILATCTSNPVFGSKDVSANALNPSPLISVWR